MADVPPRKPSSIASTQSILKWHLVPAFGTRRLNAQRIAGIEQDVHILRHTFCSHLAMKGAPARAIQELAGRPRRSVDHAALHALESGGERQDPLRGPDPDQGRQKGGV